MSSPFVMSVRSKKTYELMKYPFAFVLLSLIAHRAKRKDDPAVNKLALGQARVGDFLACGLTRQQYRTAKKKLEKLGYAKFKGTKRGTIATLTSKSVYDINENEALFDAKMCNHQNNHQNPKKRPSEETLKPSHIANYRLKDAKEQPSESEKATIRTTTKKKEHKNHEQEKNLPPFLFNHKNRTEHACFERLTLDLSKESIEELKKLTKKSCRGWIHAWLKTVYPEMYKEDPTFFGTFPGEGKPRKTVKKISRPRGENASELEERYRRERDEADKKTKDDDESTKGESTKE